MTATHALAELPRVAVDLRRGSRLFASLGARMCVPALDRQLAAGVPSWRTPRHAARAPQLTTARRRRTFVRSRPDALTEPQREVSRWLGVAN